MNTALPELLAPAGSSEALAAVIEAGADAVYIAGKRFGMRLHAKRLNFHDADLAKAIDFAHIHGRRIYVTVNNLLTNLELDQIDTLLDSLEAWQPDALIIQDLGLLHKLRRRRVRRNPAGSGPELHASCMVNVHSLGSAQMLGRLGISRIIASRDISLKDAVRLQTNSGIEFEFFLHGDMCIAQSGQCTTSGIMAGESASRGRCLKPCRWQWELVNADDKGVPSDSGLLLARKDLCLFEHVPTLVESGIAALKIEGRARAPEYLGRIVRAYRHALDAYAADPDAYTTDAESLEELRTHRIRDFSTCLTFGNPGRDCIAKDGSREPRIFSVVIEQPSLEPSSASSPPTRGGATLRGGAALADTPIVSNPESVGPKPELVVHCSSVEATEAALAGGAQGICIGGERWRQDGPALTRADIRTVSRCVRSRGAKLYGAAPRVSETDGLDDGALVEPAEGWSTTRPASLLNKGTGSELMADQDTEKRSRRGACTLFQQTPTLASEIFEGYYVHTLGQLQAARRLGLRVIGDLGFNLFNAEAIEMLMELGAVRGVASPELGLSQLVRMAPSLLGRLEFMIHGPVAGMISEHCFIEAACGCDSNARASSQPACAGGMALRDIAGQRHAILTDTRCRNHVLLPRYICALPVLGELLALGPAALRIDGRHEEPEVLREIVDVYRGALDCLARGFASPSDAMQRLIQCTPGGLSLGALDLNVADVAVPGDTLPTHEWIHPQSTRSGREPVLP